MKQILDSEVSRFGRDAMVYAIGTILGQAITFIMAPILSRLFSSAEYGLISLIMSIMTICVSLFSLNILSGFLFYFYDDQESGINQQKRIGTICVFMVISAIVGGTLVYITAPLINTLLLHLTHQSVVSTFLPFIKIISIGIACVMGSQFLGLICRLTSNTRAYVWMNVTQLCIQVIGVLILLILVDGSLIDFVWVIVFGHIAGCCVGAYRVFELLNFSFSYEFLKKSLSFSLPQLPSVMSNVTMLHIVRFLLSAFLPMSALGLYSIAEKVAGILLFFLAAFRLTWGPFAMSVKHTLHANKSYKNMFIMYCLIFGVLSIVLGAFSRPLLMIIAPPDYWQASSLVSFIVLGIFLQGLFNITSLGIGLAKRTIYLSYIQFAILCINITLNYILIKSLGLYGAAYAFSITYLLQVIFSYLVAQKCYPISYPFWKKIVWILISFVPILINAYLGQSTSPLSALIWSTLVLGISIFILGFFGISSKEHQLLRIMMSKYKTKIVKHG